VRRPRSYNRGVRRGHRLILAVAAAALLGGCSGESGSPPARLSGSTLARTWVDTRGNGTLTPGPGEPMVARTGLGGRARRPVRVLARFAQVTDAHVTDEESPARVEMLDRLGPPFTSAFRPQEALTTQVLAAIVRSVNAAGPQAVFETGDLIDNDQSNELTQALAVLAGGRVDPDSGAPGYAGVQRSSNADPLIYRPDVDPPRHPGLLAASERPFRSPGLTAPWYPLPGNHDLLVQGTVRGTAATDAVATGARKLVALDRQALQAARARRLAPEVVARLLRAGLPGRSIEVASDGDRGEQPPGRVIAALRRASGHGGRGPLMDSAVPLGPSVRAILLDTASRRGGARGVLRPGQISWLRDQLRSARDRWVVVFSATPLADTRLGGRALALLDADPWVVAAIAGDVHRNSITARPTAAGGYWVITTSSLVDYPQQARAFRLAETAGGGVVLATWMLDGDPRSRLANVSRRLAYLDYQGGRPRDLAGGPGDRNALLYKPAPASSLG
jgi:3',5'-cyclic AMP phosphodiesterase CpdA